MAAQKNRSEANKTPKELYLKLPYSILNIRELGLCEKVLLAHIYSFGARGCWQSNATLSEIFMVCPRTITQWIARLKRAGLIQFKSEKGYHRTLWARSHPDVKQAARLWYRNQQVPNPENTSTERHADSSVEDSKNRPSQCAKPRHRPGKILLPTNNTTIKETTPETTAPPSPLPAGGPAPAVLAERKKADLERIEQFKKNFGRGRTRYEPLGEEEFEKRKQQQILALMKT